MTDAFTIRHRVTLNFASISTKSLPSQLYRTIVWRQSTKISVGDRRCHLDIYDEINGIPTFHNNAISGCVIQHNAQWKLDGLATCRVCCSWTARLSNSSWWRRHQLLCLDRASHFCWSQRKHVRSASYGLGKRLHNWCGFCHSNITWASYVQSVCSECRRLRSSFSVGSRYQQREADLLDCWVAVWLSFPYRSGLRKRYGSCARRLSDQNSCTWCIMTCPSVCCQTHLSCRVKEHINWW